MSHTSLSFPLLSFNNGGVKALKPAQNRTKDRKKEIHSVALFLSYALSITLRPTSCTQEEKGKIFYFVEAGIGRSPVYPKKENLNGKGIFVNYSFLGSHVKGRTRSALLPQKFMGYPP